jgi:hypothetical protein
VNAVEILEAVSELAEQPFDPEELFVQFVAAFGNRHTTLKRRRTGISNKLAVGGAPQTRDILIATCAVGQKHATIANVRPSAVSARQKARVNRATDGEAPESTGHPHFRFGRRRRQVWAEIRLKTARRSLCSEVEKAGTHSQRIVLSSPRLATGEKPVQFLVHVPQRSTPRGKQQTIINTARNSAACTYRQIMRIISRSGRDGLG